MPPIARGGAPTQAVDFPTKLHPASKHSGCTPANVREVDRCDQSPRTLVATTSVPPLESGMGRIPDRHHQAQLIHLTKRECTNDSIDTAQGRPVYEVQLSLISRQTAVDCSAKTIAAGGLLNIDQTNSSGLLAQEHGGE